MLIWLLLLFIFPAWELKGDKPTDLPKTVSGGDWFVKAPPGWAAGVVRTDPESLGEAAGFTLRYMQDSKGLDPRALHPGLLSELGVTMDQVEWTLFQIAQTARNHPEKLSSQAWWEERFNLYLWKADALPRDPPREDRLRLTKYVVYEVEGSLERTEEFDHALWSVPKEEAHLSEHDALKKSGLLRMVLGRQDVLAGALQIEHAGAAEPLVWVTRQGLFDAMMQGTVVVRLPGGEYRWFNVHRNNGRPYVPGVADEDQDRYWFFRLVDYPLGWGWDGTHKVPLTPMVSAAGDVENLGLGKLFWLRDGNDVHLAILSDTGGAFQPNLRQLDWFVGRSESKAAFARKVKPLPSFVDAGILVIK